MRKTNQNLVEACYLQQDKPRFSVVKNTQKKFISKPET